MPDHPAILQVNTTDVAGGAARVAWDLFQVYRARGYPSWLAVGRKRTHDPDVLAIPNEAHRNAWARGWRGISRRLERVSAMPGPARWAGRLSGTLGEPARHLATASGREDFHFPGSRQLLRLPPRPPDVLHAHNLHGNYFDLRILPELSRRLPVLVTLHDAWLLSGHCAHSLACERWRIGCGACPDLSLYPSIARDATAYNWRRKRDLFAHCRLFVATPSRWLMAKVEQSILAPAVQEARVIPNGVDVRQFRPGDRREARARLGLPRDAAILLAAGTRLTHNVWKDYPTLREAARIVGNNMRGQHVLVVVLGDTSPGERVGAAHIRFVPHEQDVSAVVGYYQAADVYVHAAQVDTFPLSVLEALACGTAR
jgi:glycosyltransferase involved in cell wall biosynthesis